MREEYDLNKVKNLRKNPYVKRDRTQITIRLDSEIVSYFKSMSERTGISYQNLINSYLGECTREQKELSWK